MRFEGLCSKRRWFIGSVCSAWQGGSQWRGRAGAGGSSRRLEMGIESNSRVSTQ